MQVVVSGKGLNVSDSLREYVEENTARLVSRYCPSATRAHVVVEKNNKRNIFHLEIIVHEGASHGPLTRGDGMDADPYHSFDLALSKVTKQLRKHKDKISLVNKHKRHEAMNFTRHLVEEEGERDEAEGNNPAIVFTSSTMPIECLSVRDAVLRMEMLSMSAMLFINPITGCINLIYYAKDGSIAWTETSIKPEK